MPGLTLRSALEISSWPGFSVSFLVLVVLVDVAETEEGSLDPNTDAVDVRVGFSTYELDCDSDVTKMVRPWISSYLYSQLS